MVYSPDFSLREWFWVQGVIPKKSILFISIPKENKLWKSLSVPKSLKRDEKPQGTNQEKAFLCPNVPKEAKIHGEQIKKKPSCAQYYS